MRPGLVSAAASRLSALAIPLLAFTGCDGRGDIVLGVAGPFEESYGLANLRGVGLAVAEINSAGGVNGRLIRLVPRDDRGEGSRTAEIAREAAEDVIQLTAIGESAAQTRGGRAGGECLFSGAERRVRGDVRSRKRTPSGLRTPQGDRRGSARRAIT